MEMDREEKREKLHYEAIGWMVSYNQQVAQINDKIAHITADIMDNKTLGTNNFFTTENGVGKKATQQIIGLLETMKAYTNSLKEIMEILTEQYNKTLEG